MKKQYHPDWNTGKTIAFSAVATGRGIGWIAILCAGEFFHRQLGLNYFR